MTSQLNPVLSCWFFGGYADYYLSIYSTKNNVITNCVFSLDSFNRSPFCIEC